MKTVQPAKEIPPHPGPSSSQTETIFAVDYKKAKKAAFLSILPGLGQIYAGQKLKGILFLVITATNLLLLISIPFSKQILKTLGDLAQSFHISLNEKLIQWLFGTGITWSSPAAIFYIILLSSFILYAARDAYATAARPWRKLIAKESFLLSEVISGSYLFHISLVTIFFILVLFFIAPPPPIEQATDIELVAEEPARKSEPAKAAPKAQVIPPPVKPQPIPQKVVNQPTPVAIATPTDTPTPDPVTTQPQAATPSTNSVGTGAGNGQGEGSGNGNGNGEIDFGAYLAEMQKRIKRAWYPPKGNESKRIMVSFRISRNGTVSDINLVKSSGLTIADDAAIAAIETVSPLPQLPAGSPDSIQVKFSFDYNIFNGGKNSIY
jgi:TonB family protein